MTAVRADSLGDIGSDAVSGLAPTSDEKAAVGHALSGIASDIKTLLAQEVELAKAEIKAEVGKVGKGAGMLGGAGFAGYMVALFLSIALWWALANLMDQSWAALIVAGLWALIGAVLFVSGRSTLKSISLKPERTLNSLKQLPTAFTGR